MKKRIDYARGRLAAALQEVFVKLAKRPELLEGVREERAFLLRLAYNLGIDIIDGEPLKYHRTADGRFVLYSVGWNGKDDGGVAGKSIEESDWVWQ